MVVDRSHSVIVGLGKTGLSCARYFWSRDMSFEIVDQNNAPALLQQLNQEMPNIKVTTGEEWNIDTDKVTDLVVSPGVPLTGNEIVRARAAGIRICGDVDIFSKVAIAPIVAITGSNGKSTVTTLVGQMAESAGKEVRVGGNLGVPALDLLDDKADLYVLELSSFQLETTQNLSAHIGTILNISADHMDRYASEQDYLLAKERVFIGCKNVVLNRDDNHYENWRQIDATVSSFGVSEPANEHQTGLRSESGVTWLMRGAEKLMPVDELKIKGKHNYINALASISIASALELPLESILKVLREFEGLPYRCNLVKEIDGVEIYNDSKATNVGASVAAICGLGEPATGKLIALLGGDGKGADFSLLNEALKRYVKSAVLFGRDAKIIARAIEGATDTQFACDLESAFRQAMQLAQPGDIVVLAPACASFDMFDNYMHRGEVFDSIVKQYTTGGEV